MERLRDDFYLDCEKFQRLSDQGIDWFIKSWKYPPESDEWQICRLKEKIYNKEALENLKNAGKELGD